MIIELFGCPGCGKTYAIEALSHKDKYKNTIKTSKLKEKLGILIKKTLVLTPCAIKARIKIKKNLDYKKKYISKYSHISINKYIRNISMLVVVYRYLHKKLYIDEGIVHRVISMCINYEIPKEVAGDIIYSLMDNLKHVKTYYLDTPPEICYTSIVKRKRYEASIDFLQSHDIKIMLNEYYKYCEYIKIRFDFERIDRKHIKGELK